MANRPVSRITWRTVAHQLAQDMPMSLRRSGVVSMASAKLVRRASPTGRMSRMTDRARDETAALLADAVSLWRLTPGNANEVIDAAVQCLVADVDSPTLRELAGASPRDSQFALERLIEHTLEELGMQDVLAGNAQRGALAAVLRAFERHELSARELARWAHITIGHDGDARCQVFVDLDDMYDTVEYSDYGTEDLERWIGEEADAFLEGQPSPGRTTVWRTPEVDS
jgi:hypothetical protein